MSNFLYFGARNVPACGQVAQYRNRKDHLIQPAQMIPVEMGKNQKVNVKTENIRF